MPTIVITSDLHLGITQASTIHELVEAIAAINPDLVVLAGDIGEGLSNVVTCLQLFRQLPGDIAVLAGNHDLWSQADFSSQELWEQTLPKVVRDAGMIWLEESIWQRDTVAVVGTLAWYDYSAADSTLPAYRAGFYAGMKSQYNRDAEYIDWPWTDRTFAAQLGDALCTRLQRIEANPDIHEVLVVSHVPLFEAQILRKPGDFHWGFSNAYFGNLTLGRRVLDSSTKVRLVVSGHTHLGREGQVHHPRRPNDAPILAVVLNSDYNAPAHRVLNMAAW